MSTYICAYIPAAQLSLVRIGALSSSFCHAASGSSGVGKGGWGGWGMDEGEEVEYRGGKEGGRVRAASGN